MAVSSEAKSMSLGLFRHDGKVALVTGASRGLGAAMAMALAQAGADIALHANEQPASATADDIARAAGRRTEILTGNLAERAASDRATTENIGPYLKEEQRRHRGCIAGRMPSPASPRTVSTRRVHAA